MGHADEGAVLLIAEDYVFLILIAAAVFSRWFWPTGYIEKAPRNNSTLLSKFLWFVHDALLVTAYFGYYRSVTLPGHAGEFDLSADRHDGSFILIFVHLLFVQYLKFRYYKLGGVMIKKSITKGAYFLARSEENMMSYYTLILAWLLSIAVGIALVVLGFVQETYVFVFFILAHTAALFIWLVIFACFAYRQGVTKP